MGGFLMSYSQMENIPLSAHVQFIAYNFCLTDRKATDKISIKTPIWRHLKKVFFHLYFFFIKMATNGYSSDSSYSSDENTNNSSVISYLWEIRESPSSSRQM